MATWIDRCTTVWIDATLSAVLVTGFTALAMIQCHQPVRRRTWGRLGLAASFLAIPLACVRPEYRIDLRHPTSSTRTLELRPDRLTADPPGQNPLLDPLVATATDPPKLVGLEPNITWMSLVRIGLFLTYCGGLTLGLARLGLGLLGTTLLTLHASEASGHAQKLLATLPQAVGKARQARVLVSERTGRPVLVGFFRPTILIPPELDLPGAEGQLRLGLLHELAHAEVDDYRFGILATAAQAVWFFLPQVWWVRGQLRLDAEFLADHKAAGQFGTSYHYARSLVGLAMIPSAVDPTPDPVPEGSAPPSSRAGGLASALLQRVQMILKCPFVVEDHVPRRWVVTASCFMLVWTLVTSRLSIQDHRELSDEVTWERVDEEVYAFRLAELAIAPQLLENRLFDLRFRLPPRFRLACEVLAEPAELVEMEILGYRLDPPPMAKPVLGNQASSPWRRIEIVRDAQAQEMVRVDGQLIVSSHQPDQPASSLTIRPIPGRITRLRQLELTW